MAGEANRIGLPRIAVTWRGAPPSSRPVIEGVTVRCRTVVWIGVASTLLILPPRLLLAQATSVTCASKEAVLLGKTWGYSGDLIWISDGCSGEFLLGQLASSPRTPPASYAEQPIETRGAVEAGKGFLVGRTEVEELNISAYALTRYLNQLPAHQTFIDHLGFQHDVHTRNDIFSHRIMIFFKGWIGLTRLRFIWPTRAITGSISRSSM